MWIRFPLGLINDCLEIDKIYMQIILIKTPLYKVTGVLFLESGVRLKEYMVKERCTAVIRWP